MKIEVEHGTHLTQCIQNSMSLRPDRLYVVEHCDNFRPWHKQVVLRVDNILWCPAEGLAKLVLKDGWRFSYAPTGTTVTLTQEET